MASNLLAMVYCAESVFAQTPPLQVVYSTGSIASRCSYMLMLACVRAPHVLLL